MNSFALSELCLPDRVNMLCSNKFVDSGNMKANLGYQKRKPIIPIDIT